LGQPGTFEAIVRPSDAVLIDELASTWKQSLALLIGQANTVREGGVDLGGTHTLRLTA
jgi:hypothetical protein